MNKYTYVERTLYMAILAQESVEGNPKTVAALWTLIQNMSRKKTLLFARRTK